MSVEILKLEMVLKSISDLCEKATTGNFAHKMATIKHQVHYAQEQLAQVEYQEELEISEQLLKDRSYLFSTDYDRNSKFDKMDTVKITTYVIPVNQSTRIECVFGEFYEDGGWQKNPVVVQLLIDSEDVALNYTTINQIDQLIQLLSINKN